ncbi:PepSY-associated TM helix domain-containing protein [Sphingomonas morindae]|uniref:PepSY domain-containing protein n=1 Tax=Sphingomonas morindae TaxID=1541170 RepID=A0ABY4XD89_9SPHN|nr:PepSY-associated TM helix domain-containing protein [Sphingomonas morindae]USI74887.1 PepSY domain-containing protein [Sphingomonas morindae]
MRWIDRLHRWTGGLIGLLLALIGLTGALLVHRRAWILLPHTGDAPRQDSAHLAATVARVMADPKARPEQLIFAEPGFGLDRLAFKGGAGAYLDQAGGLVARWSSQWARPELWLFDLHRHLLAGDAGETLVGVAGLVGIGFVLTGLLLWWRTRRSFAFRLWPRRMSRPAILRHHRDLGIVMAPLLLLSFGTGTLLVFRPLTAIVFGPSAPAAIRAATAPPPAPPAPLAARLDWAAMVRVARARFPQAELRSVTLPRRGNGLITLRMRQPEEWLRGGRTILWFAADSGRLIAARDSRAAPGAARVFGLLFPLHAAEVGGLAYRLVMTLSGLTLGLFGTLTVWSFWFRRPRPRPLPAPRPDRR